MNEAADDLLKLLHTAGSDDRWELFYLYTRGLYNDFSAIADRHMDALCQFANDEKEAPLIRFQAASSFAYINLKQGDFQNAVNSYEGAIQLHSGLDPEQRKQKLRSVKLTDDGDFDLQANIASKRKDTTVGEIADAEFRILTVWYNYAKGQLKLEERVERLGADQAFIEDAMAKTGVSRDLAEEFIKFSDTKTGSDSNSRDAESVTADIVEKVKQLPEKEEAIFIEHDKRMEEIINEAHYRIFSVDLQRYESGGRKHIFDQLRVVECQQEETIMQHIASCFAMISLRLAYRPKKLFLVGGARSDALSSLLSEMGCFDISTFDSGLKDLLDKTQAEVIRTSVAKRLNQDDFPHMIDLALKIQCGNCKKAGPQLKICPCGKVYFCNQDCLKAKWKEHKPKHKLVMAKKEKKGSK
jgi:hypothetical protein